MKGCSMPAPAPCATTKQALACGGDNKSPETRVAPTSICTDLGAAAVKAIERSPRRGGPFDGVGQRACAVGVRFPRLGFGEQIRCAAHGKGLRVEPFFEVFPLQR